MSDEILDTRDLIARTRELETENWDDAGDMCIWPLSVWPADDAAEYRALTDLIQEVRESSHENPIHGVILIREDYFAEYIKDEYLEIGGEYYEYDDRRQGGQFGYHLIPLGDLIKRPPFKYIDWGAVAAGWRLCYSEIEYQGHTYLYL